MKSVAHPGIKPQWYIGHSSLPSVTAVVLFYVCWWPLHSRNIEWNTHGGQGTHSWPGFNLLQRSFAHGFDLCQVAWKATGGARLSGSAEASKTMICISGRS